MARVVVVAWLWCVVGAEEYGGAGMPQYGAEYAGGPPVASAVSGLGEDYPSRGHSPDAPAPLDYKYEEESPGNTEKPMKDIIIEETWKKPARKQRGLRRERDELRDSRADVEPVTERESDGRFPRRRARGRGARPRVRSDGERARAPRRRDREEHPDPPDYADDAHYDYDTSNVLDEDMNSYGRRRTTERVIRRKPRDRMFVKPLKSDELESEEEDTLTDTKRKEDTGSDYVDAERRRRRRPRGGGRPVPEPGARYRPSAAARARAPVQALSEEEEGSLRERFEAGEYHDYYDTRVQNIKNKLPMLLRRTTTMAPSPLARAHRSGDPPVLQRTAARRADPTRRYLSASPSLDSFLSSTATASTTPPASLNSTERLLAERSPSGSISILKKAQKKDSVTGEPTLKPPALLQVTSTLPTIVMVEPSTGAAPWKRARRLFDESPEKLEKVKRLMRHKLVANAKSVQDLTENWDDMVCQYIDTSLLESAALRTVPSTVLYANLMLLFVIVVNII